ncbi:MAG: hypothetical protein ACRCWF_06045 [Beijerinckiaceae bacterium]
MDIPQMPIDPQGPVVIVPPPPPPSGDPTFEQVVGAVNNLVAELALDSVYIDSLIEASIPELNPTKPVLDNLNEELAFGFNIFRP